MCRFTSQSDTQEVVNVDYVVCSCICNVMPEAEATNWHIEMTQTGCIAPSSHNHQNSAF